MQRGQSQQDYQDISTILQVYQEFVNKRKIRKKMIPVKTKNTVRAGIQFP